MKKKSKDQRWRWICAGSLLLASLSGNLEASGLSHPDVNPMEVSQTVRKLRGTILDTNGTPVIGASISVKGTTTGTISDMNGVFTLDVKNGISWKSRLSAISPIRLRSVRRLICRLS